MDAAVDNRKLKNLFTFGFSVPVAIFSGLIGLVWYRKRQERKRLAELGPVSEPERVHIIQVGDNQKKYDLDYR